MSKDKNRNSVNPKSSKNKEFDGDMAHYYKYDESIHLGCSLKENMNKKWQEFFKQIKQNEPKNI